MKIRYGLIEKLNNLTRAEMDLFLHVCMYAEEASGRLEGLYYRDVMQFTGMCKQSYYNALRGLSERGLIRCEKNSEVDYDISVPENTFPWKGNSKETYRGGYIDLTRDIFRKGAKFWELKAHEKYLCLEFMKRTHEHGHSYRINVSGFYAEWKRALGVSARVIRGYLSRLRQYFSIGIKNGMYYITYRHSVFQKAAPGDPGHKKQELYWHEQLIRKECNRLHIAYTPDALADTAVLIGQHRKQAGGRTETMVSIVTRCIGLAVDGIRKCDRVLNPKYIHKLVAERVNAIAASLSGTDAPPRGEPTRKKNAFHNFNQRDYDYNELEKLLLATNPT